MAVVRRSTQTTNAKVCSSDAASWLAAIGDLLLSCLFQSETSSVRGTEKVRCVRRLSSFSTFALSLSLSLGGYHPSQAFCTRSICGLFSFVALTSVVLARGPSGRRVASVATKQSLEARRGNITGRKPRALGYEGQLSL